MRAKAKVVSADHWALLERDTGKGPLTDEQLSVLLSDHQSPSKYRIGVDMLLYGYSRLHNVTWSGSWIYPRDGETEDPTPCAAETRRSAPEAFLRALEEEGLA